MPSNDSTKQNGNGGLPDILTEVFAREESFDAAGDRVPLKGNVNRHEALEIYQVVKSLNAATTAEVGFAQGVSTLAILQALVDGGGGTHHVMDPFQAKFDDVGRAMVERAGLSDKMRFYRQFADEVIPQLPELDFCFIDSSHLFDLTVSEFVMTDRKLRVGGIVAFHDMWMPSLRRVVRYILENRAYEHVIDLDFLDRSYEPTVGQRVKYSLLGALRRMPGSQKIFETDVIRSWNTLKIKNLVFLRKTGEDNREWTFHRAF